MDRTGCRSGVRPGLRENCRPVQEVIRRHAATPRHPYRLPPDTWHDPRPFARALPDRWPKSGAIARGSYVLQWARFYDRLAEVPVRAPRSGPLYTGKRESFEETLKSGQTNLAVGSPAAWRSQVE